MELRDGNARNAERHERAAETERTGWVYAGELYESREKKIHAGNRAAVPILSA